jgi:S-DNA-T family DNA segregation ATPase FtsK/SpoIIIE
MPNLYELMAYRIEQVFTSHNIPCKVDEARVTARLIRFEMRIALGYSISRVEGLAEEIALAVNASSVRVQRHGGSIIIEVARDGVSRQIGLAACLAKITAAPPNTALLGVDTTGEVLLLRIDSPDVAHILLAGTTGSGKTALLRTLLLTLAMFNRPGHLQLVLIDPKGKLAPLAALPHTWRGLGCISDPADAVLVLAGLVAEMERRDRAGSTLPRIVLVIDELADLMQSGGPAVGEHLLRLTQRGRESGIDVIAATQKPAAALVGSLVKANFPVRLVGSVVSTDDAKVASGVGGTGAERLLGRGDFLCIVKGDQIRFQAAYISASEIPALITAISASTRKRRTWSSGAVQAAIEEQAGQSGKLPALPVRRPATVAEALAPLFEAAGGPGGSGGWVGGNPHAPQNVTAGAKMTDAAAHPPTHPPTYPVSRRRARPPHQAHSPRRSLLCRRDLPRLGRIPHRRRSPTQQKTRLHYPVRLL